VTSYSETRRQIVHIAMAAFALLLPYLTWPQAAGLAGAALVFNAIALGRLAPAIIREADKRGIRAGVLYYPLSILVLILIFRRHLDFVAAAWGVMAFGDGFATLAGKLFGGPRLPWNLEKTWSGLIAFVVCGAIGAVALSTWFWLWHSPLPPFATPQSHWDFRFWTPIAAAVVAGLVETIPIKLDDNISVPATAGAVMWFVYQINRIGPFDTLAMDLATGLLISIPIALLALRVGNITIGGAITGVVFAVIIYAGFYLGGLVVLAIALALTIASSRISRSKAPQREGARGERRGVGNIIANCLVGTLGALLEVFSFNWGSELAAVWLVAGIVAGASDTVASEVGKTWGGTPRSFPTWRAVPAGTPGAISFAGTAAGIAAATIMSGAAVAMWLIPVRLVAPVVAACTVGAFAESALSTRFEADGVLDNNTLNFLNTAIAAGLAVWWARELLAWSA
jgi:uncharacterized protein (TIGR00297 family)